MTRRTRGLTAAVVVIAGLGAVVAASRASTRAAVRSLIRSRFAPTAHDGPRLPLLEAQFTGWQITAFHTPRVTPLSPGARIESAADSSGVMFRTKLASNQLHRLVLRGDSRSAALPGLRLRQDGSAYVWQAIGREGGDVVLPRGSQLEVLFYNDVPYVFDLREIRVEPCPQCLTPDAFKALVASEAGVANGDGGVVLARKLRNWVANAVVFALDPATVDRTTYAVATQPAHQIYVDYFRPAGGGVSCGGAAVFLQKVLSLFGVPSFTLGIGYDGTLLTHVTTVVVDTPARGDSRRFYVFDPTFAGAYLVDGTYVDLADLVRGETARFETDPMSRRVLVPRRELESFLDENERAHSRAVCDRPSVVADTVECRGFVDNVAFNTLAMRPLLEQRGIPLTADFIVTLARHAVISYGPSDLDPAAPRVFEERVTESQHVWHSRHVQPGTPDFGS